MTSQLNGWFVTGIISELNINDFIKQAGYRLLVIDDYNHLDYYCADIILNQNLHAFGLSYLCEPYTRLLLGPRFALLRKEFRAWPKKRP